MRAKSTYIHAYMYVQIHRREINLLDLIFSRKNYEKSQNGQQIFEYVQICFCKDF